MRRLKTVLVLHVANDFLGDRLQKGSPYMLLDRCLSVMPVCDVGV